MVTKIYLYNPTFPEIYSFNEIKTIWANGNFQYAYGTKVNAESEDNKKISIDQNLLKILKKKGKNHQYFIKRFRFTIYH